MTAPASVDLELVPVPGRPGWYAAAPPDGRVLVQASRQPFLDAARTLARRGAAPETVVAARHRGSAVVALRATIGEAAAWRIEESDAGGLKQRRWSPFEAARLSAHGVPGNAPGGEGREERERPAAPLVRARADPRPETVLPVASPWGA